MKSFFKNMGTFSGVLLAINLLGVLIMTFTITYTQREAYSSIYSSYSRTVIEPSALGITLTIAALIMSIVLHLILLGISRIGLKVYENEADEPRPSNWWNPDKEEGAGTAYEGSRIVDNWLKNSKEPNQAEIASLTSGIDAIRSKIDKAFNDRGTTPPEYQVEILSGEPAATGYLPGRHALTITNTCIELSAPSLSDYIYHYFSCVYEACCGKTLVDPAKFVQRIRDSGNAWQEDGIAYTFEFDREKQLFIISAVKSSD